MSEQKIHVAVGFYPNGGIAVNYVRDEDLAANIAYNATYRPGRVYFVNGEYVCGGTMEQPALDEFIENCKRSLAEHPIPMRNFDSKPYH